MIVLWFGLVVVGIATMQWGASRAADLLDALRDRWGLPATAGGALMGLATASPETAVNIGSVAFGWPNLGLGTALGSNVPALPLAFLLSYLASRAMKRAPKDAPAPARRADKWLRFFTDADLRFASNDAPSKQRSTGLFPNVASTFGSDPSAPQVKPQAVKVQVLPYLLIVFLLGALTLPPRWSGLQPMDGLILLAAFGIYLAHALLRKPWTDRGTIPSGMTPRAMIGIPAVALGALASVIGAQKVGEAFGISELVTGLFVIGFLCALPEAYSAWRFTREGRPTVAVSTATADGIVSLTIALLAPALIGTAVGDVSVYLINLVFLAGVLATYIAFNRSRRGQELGPGRVFFYGTGYAIYLAAIAYVLMRGAA
jgi:cation:H+ antiporter